MLFIYHALTLYAKSHVDNWTKNSTDFTCTFCTNKHNKTECEHKNDIVKKDEHLLELEKEHKNYSLINNDELTSLIEVYKHKGDAMIKSNKDHFKRIINEIDTKKVELILRIEKLANELIEKANKEMQKYDNELNTLNNNAIDVIKSLDPTDEKIEKIKTEIRRTKWDYVALDKINEKTVNDINTINEELIKFTTANLNFEKCSSRSTIKMNFCGTKLLN